MNPPFPSSCITQYLIPFREHIYILLSLSKDKKKTKSCFCLVDFATAAEASQAIKNANRMSTSWGKLRVSKPDSWAVTYPQKGSGKFEAEEDVREESSKGKG